MKNGLRTFLLTVIIMCFFLGSADVVCAVCTISATPVHFGNYDVFSPAPLDASGSITVQCDDQKKPPDISIAIGPSPNSGGFDPRMMKHVTVADLFNYNLYTDINRTKIWGDGSGNTNTVRVKSKKNIPRTTTVYGRIPPLQDVSAGPYNEVLTVTITW